MRQSRRRRAGLRARGEYLCNACKVAFRTRSEYLTHVCR